MQSHRCVVRPFDTEGAVEPRSGSMDGHVPSIPSGQAARRAGEAYPVSRLGGFHASAGPSASVGGRHRNHPGGKDPGG
jgi:hypothetical protein